MKFNILSCLLISFMFTSCGGNGKAKEANAAPAAPAEVAAPVEYMNSVAFEGIPKERILHLWDNCTYLDYIFHDLPFSMSQDEQGSIRANLSYIAQEAQPFINKKCKPMARQMFHVEGEIVLEVDVYLSNDCQCYVFVENEKPVYANKMTEDALNFFQSMFNQANKQRPNN